MSTKNIESKYSDKTSAETEFKQLKEQLHNPSSQSDQMYSQLIMELGKSKTSVETQITEIKSNLSVYTGQI